MRVSLPPSQLKRWKSAVIGLVVLVVALTACGSQSATTPGAVVAPTTPNTNAGSTTPIVLKISGSGTTSAILSAVKPAFEADMPGYRLELLPGTETGGGVQGVIKGVLDVAAMARPPKDEEAAQHVEYVEFGKGGATIFTHPGVNVTNLTTDQSAAIFAGQITNWSQVGGPDMPIVLYVRNEDESSTKALRTAVFGDTPFPPATIRVLASQSEMLVAVEGTPGSVGFGWWPAALAKGTKVHAVALDGQAPAAPNYPVIGGFGIGYLTNRTAEVQPLTDWLRSTRGQAALQQFGLITTR